MKRSLSSTGLRWLWLTLVVLIIDLGTKQWVMQNFELHETLPIMPFINFFYAHNYGAAFSFLADKGGWQRWMFAVIALVIAVTLIVMMYRSSYRQRMTNCAYALIIGGALGNLSDRLIHGMVIDFIDFYVGDWHFPTFNMADSAICIGAVLIVLEGLIRPADKTPHQKE
ncbi:signal peptidase II [Acerihabitans sp. TG2]|uniref:signal peptidase II n=1 Tax=Acerihabitans sp. TG2 TaxID=3096008 RepID=UPI002B22FD2F|nr:signal peptidase II [Acerihabitans sp. TG2]MEA9392810.1 signal peptidase II [Acerihabitans sp. TG2]